MFPKAAAIYQIVDLTKMVNLTEDKLEPYAFAPIGTSAALSMGFAKEQDVFAYNYGGHTLLNFTIEKKSVPASAIKAAVQKIRLQREETNGHLPGKKATKEIKERVVDELLTRAIPSTKTHKIFIDRTTGYVTFDTTSNAVITSVLGRLYQVGEIELANIPFPGRARMASWLADEEGDDYLPDDLTADDTVVFEYPGDTGKTVKYERSNLSDTDVVANLEAGAEVLSLALTYDDKISFVLKDGMLGRIRVTGVLNEKYTGPKEDAFQNAFYLAAAEMSNLTTFLKESA